MRSPHTRSRRGWIPCAKGNGTGLIALEYSSPNGVIGLPWYETFQAARPVAQITLLLVGTRACLQTADISGLSSHLRWVRRGDLTDQQWQRLEPLLPPEKPWTGRPNED